MQQPKRLFLVPEALTAGSYTIFSHQQTLIKHSSKLEKVAPQLFIMVTQEDGCM